MTTRLQFTPRRVLALAILAVSCYASSAQARQWVDIRIGVDAAYKPFTYKTPEGELTGFDVDIARALCAQLKAHCTFVEQNWDGIIPALNAHKFDAIISSMTITDERRRVVEFTDRYYYTPSRAVVRKGSHISDAQSFKGHSVGVLKASVQERYAKQVLAPHGARIVSYDTQEQVYLDMNTGRIDATIADQFEASEGFLKSADGAKFELAGPELRDPAYFGYGAGIAVRKSDTDLRDQFNAAIKAIRATGVYKQVNDKYFAFDVYGN
jgi:arginine/ornithine transport system substrate-binding protein